LSAVAKPVGGGVSPKNGGCGGVRRREIDLKENFSSTSSFFQHFNFK
jgi:hypothetical protein